MSQRSQFLVSILIIFVILLALAIHFLFFLESYVDTPTTADLNSPYRLNARIIRFRAMDSVIAGTSMSKNFKCSEFDKITGGHSYKLTVPGGEVPKTCRIVDFACRRHEIRAVLIDLHTRFLMVAPPEKQWVDDRYYSDNSLLGDLLDGASFWSLKDRRKYYAVRLDGKKPASTWSRDEIYCNTDPCGKQYLAREILTGNWKIILHRPNPVFLAGNIDDHLLPLFRNHPQTTFYLFLPPFSPFAYIGYEEWTRQARKAAMDRFLPLPNVKLYDFQGVSEICTNYDNYKDITHYSMEISQWILEQIKADNHRVTPLNRRIFEKRFDDMLKSFDAEKELERMRQYSREHPVSR